MNDTITIKVKETECGQDRWTQYELTYEQFSLIQPVLDMCKDEKECTYDPSDPDSAKEMMQAILFPYNGRKPGIVYNLKEKPKDKTLQEVIDYYRQENVLMVESDNNPTRML